MGHHSCQMSEKNLKRKWNGNILFFNFEINTTLYSISYDFIIYYFNLLYFTLSTNFFSLNVIKFNFFLNIGLFSTFIICVEIESNK